MAKINFRSKLSLFFISIVVVIGFVIFSTVLIENRESMKISAKPTGEITIDDGTPDKLVIPKDGTKVWEPDVSTLYNDFVQTQSKVANLEMKSALPQQYQQPYKFTKNAELLSGNRRLLIWDQHNHYGVVEGGEPWLLKSGLAIVDNGGNVINEIEFATGNKIDHNSLNQPVRNSLPYGNILHNPITNEYSVIYQTSTAGYNVENTLMNFKVESDSSFQILSRKKIGEMSLSDTYKTTQDNLQIIMDSSDMYQLGYISPNVNPDETAVIGGAATSITDYKLYRFNINNNSFSLETTLHLPKFNDISVYSNPNGVSSAAKKIMYVQPLKDNVGNIVKYAAEIWYGSGNSTIPIDEAGKAVLIFDKNGNIISNIQSDVTSRETRILKEICTEEKVYIEIQDSDQTRVISIDTSGAQSLVIGDNRLPISTSLTIIKSPDSVFDTEYEFFGSIYSLSGDFSNLNNSGQVIGSLYANFKMANVQSLSGGIANFTSYQASNTKSTNILFSGYTSDQSFASEAPKLRAFPTTAPLGPGWVPYTFGAKDGFYGVSGYFAKNDDFAPLIKSNDNIKVSIDSPAIQSPTSTSLNNWDSLSRWLITGKENGTMNNASAIKVYDTTTSNDASFGQNWLEKRINLNGSKTTLPIDWRALGFDDTHTGPQRVTYFVSDSQKQISATSRWINATDNHTSSDKDDNVFLKAENFAISRNDVSSLTEIEVRKKAKTQAWLGIPASLTDPYTEDMSTGKDSGGKVKVDTTQLATIKAVTANTKIKPYPLDITYTDSLADGSKKNVKHRIWVFVTNDNTTIDNSVVLYGDDFSLPLREAGASTPDTLLKKVKFKQTQPSVVVYDYVAQPQDKKELIPLSKGKTDGTTKGLSLRPASMNQITSATVAMTIPNVDFTYTNPVDSKTTTVKVTVTIDDQKEFCFKLERTKEKLIVVDPVIDTSVSNNYKSIEVKVPLHVTMDTPVALPTNWQSFPVVSDAVSNTYQFNMKTKNDKQSLEDFLSTVKFTIGLPVDKPGEVMITLREDELLAGTPPLSKSAKGKMLRSSQVIATNDFRLEAESKWDDTDEVNYVDLEWEAIPNVSTSGYQLMQSENNGVSWNARSLNYGKAIKVLNVYPDLAASNTLQGWMDGLGLTDKDGNNLIQVTPITLSNFNSNPDSFLKNATGEYLYDVLMFGSWDSNSGVVANQTATDSIHDFLSSGRGVLFGHDTVGVTIPSFEGMLGVTPMVPLDEWTGADKVKVINNGYLMKYPFELQNDITLNIPYSHHLTHQYKNIGTTWLEFSDPLAPWDSPIYDDGAVRGGWYLKTNNNVGMIQTGHSMGQSTIDERKIIANTLYNLAQVSIDSNGQDYTVKDDVGPKITTVKRDFDNNVVIAGEDIGKKYQYYVTGDTKDKGTLKSDVVEEVVTSDIRGYIYTIDTVATTVPPVIKDPFGKVTNINAPVVNPEVSREATISGFTSNDQWLHVIPVDRANNVGAVKHIQMKDITYAEAPEAIKYSGNIPQKIYIKGKDDQGNSLTLGDQVLETNLRIGEELSFTSTTIPWYSYQQLAELDGTVISPEVVTVSGIKQDIEAIYTRSLTTLHVRQVIVDPVLPLVESLRGEGVLSNTTTLGGPSQADLPMIYPTREDALAGFKTITYEVDTAKPFYGISPIIPEYYSYVGHVLTTTNTLHSASMKVTGQPAWDITNQPEVWVTMYLTPNTSGGKNPGLYGWNYGNDGTYLMTP